MNRALTLQPVDAVEVTIVVDNFLDVLMPSTEIVRRGPLVWDWAERDTLVAEHGFSLLVTVRRGGRTDTVLFDAGRGRGTAIHNLDVLGIRFSDLRAVALSHGHVDHHGGLLIAGQVARVTDFEKGFPLQQARAHGGCEPDTWIWDDQPMVLNLRNRGLVVLSCCSHASIINVLRHAQQITGVQKVHAVVGGLHLTGGLFEPIVPRTIDELAAIAPDVLVPCHCTGWKATHELARRLPDAYVQSSVGTRLHLT